MSGINRLSKHFHPKSSLFQGRMCWIWAACRAFPFVRVARSVRWWPACFVWKLFFKAWLDLLLDSAIFTALINHKGNPWARKKMIRLDVYGILKPVLPVFFLQIMPPENLKGIFTCAGTRPCKCVWMLQGHIWSNKVNYEVLWNTLKYCEAVLSRRWQRKLLCWKNECLHLRAHG